MGGEIEIVCDKCGSEISADDTYCSNCIGDLEEEVEDLKREVDDLNEELNACANELRECKSVACKTCVKKYKCITHK